MGALLGNKGLDLLIFLFHVSIDFFTSWSSRNVWVNIDFALSCRKKFVKWVKSSAISWFFIAAKMCLVFFWSWDKYDFVVLLTIDYTIRKLCRLAICSIFRDTMYEKYPKCLTFFLKSEVKLFSNFERNEWLIFSWFCYLRFVGKPLFLGSHYQHLGLRQVMREQR